MEGMGLGECYQLCDMLTQCLYLNILQLRLKYQTQFGGLGKAPALHTLLFK